MKKLMAIFALAIIGSALIGCGAKEETTPTGTGDSSAGKMEEKPGGTQTPSDK